MYRLSFRARSETDVNTPRAITSRSTRANQISTWFSQEEYVGVKCSCTLGLVFKKGLHELGFVCRQIVQDDVNFLGGGALRQDLLQKIHELLAGMSSGGFAVDAASLCVERRVEG